MASPSVFWTLYLLPLVSFSLQEPSTPPTPTSSSSEVGFHLEDLDKSTLVQLINRFAHDPHKPKYLENAVPCLDKSIRYRKRPSSLVKGESSQSLLQFLPSYSVTILPCTYLHSSDPPDDRVPPRAVVRAHGPDCGHLPVAKVDGQQMRL